MKLFTLIITILAAPFLLCLGVIFYLLKKDKRPDTDWQEEIENHMKWEEQATLNEEEKPPR